MKNAWNGQWDEIALRVEKAVTQKFKSDCDAFNLEFNYDAWVKALSRQLRAEWEKEQAARQVEVKDASGMVAPDSAAPLNGTPASAASQTAAAQRLTEAHPPCTGASEPASAATHIDIDYDPLEVRGLYETAAAPVTESAPPSRAESIGTPASAAATNAPAQGAPTPNNDGVDSSCGDESGLHDSCIVKISKLERKVAELQQDGMENEVLREQNFEMNATIATSESRHRADIKRCWKICKVPRRIYAEECASDIAAAFPDIDFTWEG